MNEEIFRKKSLDRVRSPEELNEYVKVSNPGIWLLMASVIILLIGACIWGFFGHIDTRIDATALTENGMTEVFISVLDAGEIGEKVTAIIDGKEYTFDLHIDENVVRDDASTIKLGSVKTGLPDGVHPAKIVVERIKPMSFIFN